MTLDWPVLAEQDMDFSPTRLPVWVFRLMVSSSPECMDETMVLPSQYLNISGMLKNHKHSRAISDLGFYELSRQPEYKSPMYGNSLGVVGRSFQALKIALHAVVSKKTFL